jgi:hypothetical protein
LQGHFYTKQYDKSYWAEPEQLDSYLTYATRYTIEEVSQEMLDKMAAVKQKFVDSTKKKAKKDWQEFIQANAGKCNSDLLEILMEEYKFPSKIKEK